MLLNFSLPVVWHSGANKKKLVLKVTMQHTSVSCVAIPMEEDRSQN